MTNAQVIQPDFAYPQKTAKAAAEQLQRADKAGDAPLVLQSLLVLTVSNTMVDPATLAENIRLTSQYADKYADSQLSSLFDVLLARLYLAAYERESWKYDSRSLPLTPMPADITEWSGEQYRHTIQKLCDNAIAADRIAKISDLKISDYAELIDCDNEISAVYYPTLADFVYANVASLLDSTEQSEKVAAVYRQALESNPPSSAPRMLWLKELTIQNDGDYDEYKRIFLNNSDNQYAGIVLSTMFAIRAVRDVDQKKWFVGEAEKFNARFPENPFLNQLKNQTVQAVAPEINLSMPSLVALDTPFAVSVVDKNVNDYTIQVYLLSEARNYDFDSRRTADRIKTLKPVQTINVHNDQTAPFQADTTVRVTLDRPGFYCIVPMVDGKVGDDRYIGCLRCVPIVPLAFDTDGKHDIIIADAANGAPVKGASVGLYRDKTRMPGLGVTDAKGLAQITVPKKNRYNLTVGYQGREYDFNNMSFYDYGSGFHSGTSYIANILTDRALYHPGDEVNMLIVAAKSLTLGKNFSRSLLAGQKVTVTIYDPNNEEATKADVILDDYGRTTISFTAPVEGLTGRYSVNVKCDDGYMQTYGGNFTVSDYRMPDFEITVDPVACDVPAKGQATVKGRATTYSGMPMANIDIDVTLLTVDWWWWRQSGNDQVYATKIKTDDAGEFEIVLGPEVFTEHESPLYEVRFDAVAPNGSTASGQQTFSLTKQYHITVDLPAANIDGEKPLRPDVKVFAADGEEVKLPLVWRIVKTGDQAAAPYSQRPYPQQTVDVDTIASGVFTGQIDLSNITPGTYRLCISAEDESLANVESTDITIYNKASGIVPDPEGLWVLHSSQMLPYDSSHSDKIDVEYATGKSVEYIYYTLESEGRCVKTDVQQIGYGYHTLAIDIPAGMKYGRLTLWYVHDTNIYMESVSLTRPAEKPIKIEGSSFRDNLVPGAEETWQIKVVNADGSPLEAALALDMYNKALDALSAHSIRLRFPSMPAGDYLSFDKLWFNLTTNTFNISRKPLNFDEPEDPEFKYLDLLSRYSRRFASFRMMKGSALPSMSTNDMDDGEADYVLCESVVEDSVDMSMDFGTSASNIQLMSAGAVEPKEAETEDTETAPEPQEEFDYRDADVPMAIWAPMLTTDADGNVCYTFTVPNANTTWRLQAVAWTKDMKVGTMARDFVASKPVMVMPNLPRFMRTGDSATLLATVMNNTDSTVTVTTVVEIFNPVTSEIMASKQYTNTLDGKQNATVSIDVAAGIDATAIGYRVRSSNGTFSDGEQSVIRVLSSHSELIETTPFYLNPGETEYEMQLPSDDGARITLTYCENPAWTIVTALPGLRSQICEYANSAAAALFSAAVAQGVVRENPAITEALRIWAENPTDSALVSMLQRNEDLKLAVLNATPWVQAAKSDTERMANLAMIFDKQEVDASIKQAIKILEDLQHSDGGWAWGKWCDESSVWVTSNVLAMMGDLKSCGWLPKDKKLDSMIERALKYYDSQVKETDMVYTLVRPHFSLSVSANGQKVIDATLKMIRKDWKKYTDPAYKAMAAEALWLNGDKPMAQTLMASVSEFGIYTKSQGLKFPSVNGLYNYAILLEAYGLICPDSKEVDGLRQQLIVRKQGADWGTAVVTTEVVRSILTTGSKWTVAAQGAKIEVGDSVIEPSTPIETATGWLRADLSKYAGDGLHISTPGTGPSYGAVYAQFARQMQDVKASGCDDLDIEKQLFVRDGTGWAVPTELHVGDRVKVQLTIHCKRNLSYVSIIDERPAAFEPVDQLPGWMWSEGVGFYRENRDSQTTMHVVYMSPGTYLLTYEMNVGVAGDFSSGVASIQSQYAPELSAHSSGSRLRVD